jgi:hypothetical protein
MTSTLVLPESIVVELNAIAAQHLETAGVLLVGIISIGDNQFRLLGREFHPVPESAYIRREQDAMTITSHGYVPALARAEEIGATALWVHSHPGIGSSPLPSSHDRIVDEQLAELFRLRSGSEFYGALIVSPTESGIAFTGHVETEAAKTSSIDRLWQVGDRFRLNHSAYLDSQEPLDMFDRNVRALGPAVQNALRDLKVGIAGCGGTGSAIAEQLVRLGVRSFLLIDPDTLSISNTTRVYGSTPKHIGRPKVEVAAENIRSIAPDAKCEAIQSTLNMVNTAKRLAGCDIVFGCTDDNAGRLVLSRLPTYLLVPVIDCGVLVTSDEKGMIVGIDGRVTIIDGRSACLLCRGRIDLARAAAELMTPEERIRLENEGYAPALGRTEPAVITFTSLVAATAVSELLERLIGYGPEPRPSEVLLRCHEREISTNVATPRIGHYCNDQSGKLGRGMTEPFLEMTWAS